MSCPPRRHAARRVTWTWSVLWRSSNAPCSATSSTPEHPGPHHRPDPSQRTVHCGVPTSGGAPTRVEGGTSVKVTVYHNVAADDAGRHLGILDGYQPDHPVTPVFATELPA